MHGNVGGFVVQNELAICIDLDRILVAVMLLMPFTGKPFFQIFLTQSIFVLRLVPFFGSFALLDILHGSTRHGSIYKGGIHDSAGASDKMGVLKLLSGQVKDVVHDTCLDQCITNSKMFCAYGARLSRP